MDEQGTAKNPIVMKMIAERPPLIQMFVLTVAPVAIAILMQKPALRQVIAMRLAHDAKEFCQGMADFWQDMALKCGTAYHKARM